MTRESQNWSATESTDFAGGHRKLLVEGEVQTFAGNERVSLREAASKGTEAGILTLEVSVQANGTGIQVLGWKAVRFEKPVTPQQYRKVLVTVDGAEQAIEVHEEIS